MTTAHKNAMRGLTVFITEVRNSPNKEGEEKRVNKELAKIRKKFKEEPNMEGYDRKKYVCKLIYVYLLGENIDFGYMEAVALLSSPKFQEKLIGYLALTLLLHENHEMLPLIVQSLQNDLQSRNEYHQNMALTAIANIGGKEMAESLAPIVQKLLVSKATKATIKKKAALCLLRLYRKYPELITPDVWCERIITLLDETDLGVLTGVMNLLLGLSYDSPKGYEPAVKKVVAILTKIIINRDFTKDYMYYNMPNPWLQVKLLRFLSNYEPPEDKTIRTRLYEILKKILNSADEAKGQTINHKNALNAVLFEAIDLVIELDDDRELIRSAIALLGRFISAKEHSNIRYLALEALGHLATLDSESANLVKKFQETVILALRDPDISIRKRALDLIYGMCDKNNSKTIVSELLNYLQTADFAIREELVLKIAILGEKFSTNSSWYVDVILQLISLAGDQVSDEIWFRVVQIVTNHEDIQEYAASTVLKAAKQPNAHETAVKVAGYILGEFGHLISEKEGCGPRVQFESLHSKFPSCSLPTRSLLLSTYVKFVNLYPELAETIRPIFKANQTNMDAEVQQRSCEYLKLCMDNHESLLQSVWDVMPAFPERDRSGASDKDNTTDEGMQKTASSPSIPKAVEKSPKQDPRPKDPLEELLGGVTSTPTNGAYGVNPGYPYGATATPTTASNSASSGSLLDGLDFGTASPTPGYGRSQASVASPVIGSAAIENDFLGISSPSTATSPTSPTPVAITASNSAHAGSLAGTPVTDAFKKLCMTGEGVLYQDENLQIGFKSEYSQGMGRMMLYYGNVTSSAMSSFSANVVAPRFLNMNAQPIAQVVEARTQAQQLLTMSALLSDFNDFPTLQLNFNSNGRPILVNLRLPIVIAKFTEPFTMSGPDFFSNWKQIGETPPLCEQAVVKSPRPIDMAWLKKLVNVGCKCAVLEGVDPNVNNLVAAGNVTTSSSTVPCFIRMETNAAAAMYRITVKSSNPQITAGIKDLLATQLG